ncbi:hypothetical protein BKA66DRAFT_572684 [Pyrenochaeta sp. MPI-SDFR-AT-0127]|nr:hypothetical protein BKA66DRAFT_572684 [Pyrenochaeta sp. MPI-SDFR-AT-0127]
MGKYTDMDSDSERLPPGFTRTGYDADTQTYTFSSPDGRTYQSEPGNRYGELYPLGQRPRRSEAEIEENNAAVSRNNTEAVRMMLPFALLVFVFLILMFKLVNRPESDQGAQQALDCAEGSHKIQIHKGDTCWQIGKEYSLGVEELLKLVGNEHVDCEKLSIGQGICVPEKAA